MDLAVWNDMRSGHKQDVKRSQQPNTVKIITLYKETAHHKFSSALFSQFCFNPQAEKPVRGMENHRTLGHAQEHLKDQPPPNSTFGPFYWVSV